MTQTIIIEGRTEDLCYKLRAYDLATLCIDLATLDGDRWGLYVSCRQNPQACIHDGTKDQCLDRLHEIMAVIDKTGVAAVSYAAPDTRTSCQTQANSKQP
jgi:hypothetical protein